MSSRDMHAGQRNSAQQATGQHRAVGHIYAVWGVRRRPNLAGKGGCHIGLIELDVWLDGVGEQRYHGRTATLQVSMLRYVTVDVLVFEI